MLEIEDFLKEEYRNFLDKENPKSNGKAPTLIEPCPPKKPSTEMAITVSPPMHDNRDAELFMYLYLMPLREMIEEGNTVVYCEFSKSGRLHYHVDIDVPNDKYGQYFRFVSSVRELYKPRAANQYKIRYHKPVNGKRIYIKKFMLKAQIDVQLNCVEYTGPEHVSKQYKSWKEYCQKECEHTEAILGEFHKIDKNTYKKLRSYIENKFSINII